MIRNETARADLTVAAAPRAPSSSALFGALTDGADLAVVLLDSRGEVELWNPAAERITGWTAAELLGRPLPWVSGDGRLEFLPTLDRVIAGESILGMELDGERIDGSPLVLRVRMVPVPDGDGVATHAFVIAEDVTDQKAAKQALAEAETRYRTLVEQLPGIVYAAEFGESGCWQYASSFSEALVGFSPKELLEHPGLWWEHVHPEDRERVMREEAITRESGEELRSDYRMLTRAGETVWVLDVATVVRDEAGAPQYLQGVILDLTKQKRAEAQLADSAQELQAIILSEPECVKLVGNDGTLQQMNPAGLEMIEADSAGAAIGLSFYPIVVKEHREAFRTLNESVFDGHSGTLDFDIVGLKGTRRSMETHSVPLRGAEGKVVACLSVTRDVTDRKRAEAELEVMLQDLRRSNEERVQMLSRLIHAQEDERKRISSAVHDDTIQKMTIVGLRLGTIAAGHPNLAEDAKFAALRDSVEQATTRLRSLIFELRPLALDTGGLAAALHWYVDEQDKAGGGPNYRIVSKLAEEPPEDVRITLYRLIQEALTNARKHAEASTVDVFLDQRDGGFFVRVHDDGIGFDQQEAHLQWAPGHLGLSDMGERARLAGGWLRVSAALNEGTTVEMWLPDARQGTTTPKN